MSLIHATVDTGQTLARAQACGPPQLRQARCDGDDRAERIDDGHAGRADLTVVAKAEHRPEKDADRDDDIRACQDKLARAAIEVLEEPVVTAFRALKEELEVPCRERRVRRAPSQSQP